MSNISVLPLLLLLLALARRSVGDALLNQFIYPGPSGPSNNFRANLVMTLGTSETIQWTSNTSNPFQLSLFQQAIGPESGLPIETLCSGTNTAGKTSSCTWTVQLYTTNLTFSPVYFFWVNPGVGPDSFTSHYFNITAPVTSTSTTSTSSRSTSSSTTTSSSTSSTTITVASLTTTTSTTPTPTAATTGPTDTSGTGEHSTALSVGMGVGLGIGIPLVLIAGVFLGLRIVKQRRQPWHGQDGQGHGPFNQPMAPGDIVHSQAGQPYDSRPAVFELPYKQDPRVYEAPAQEPGWGPDGRYEAGSKTPRIAEM